MSVIVTIRSTTITVLPHCYGMTLSGISPDGRIRDDQASKSSVVYIGTQAHPGLRVKTRHHIHCLKEASSVLLGIRKIQSGS